MIETLFIVLEQSFLSFPLILGAYLSFSLLKIPDLSIESAYVFGSILSSLALPCFYHTSPVISLFCLVCLAIFGGVIVGVISSALTQKAGLPHLLSSILTIGFFHGINQFILGSSLLSLSGFSNSPELILVAFFIVLGLLGYLFLKTRFGNALVVYGNNPQFFENYGISTPFVFITGVCIANGLAGISGYFDAQTAGFVDVNMGIGKALLCITALILGKVFVHTNKPFSIFVPIAGTLAYFSLQQLLLHVGFNLKYFTAVQALLVFIILFIKNKTVKTKRAGMVIDNLGI